jgi:putative transposase
MPDHFHVLVRPGPEYSTSSIVKEIKTADVPSCRTLLRSFRLPPTVNDEAHYRVWRRRFVPFNVYTENKRLQKLDYMHNNPVTRRLVSSAAQWPWSSWRFYYLEDRSVLEMDRVG